MSNYPAEILKLTNDIVDTKSVQIKPITLSKGSKDVKVFHTLLGGLNDRLYLDYSSPRDSSTVEAATNKRRPTSDTGHEDFE